MLCLFSLCGADVLSVPAVLAVLGVPSALADLIRDLRSVRLPPLAAQPAGSATPHYESRVVVHRAGELSFPVEIELMLSNGDSITHAWDGRGRDRVLTQVAVAPVVSAQVDPRDVILLDENLLDNARSVEHPTPVASWDPRGR